MEKILGLHHVTAIAGDPQQNFDFYTGLLGLRFIKKTVNFDDPGIYHFYFGNGLGSAGTILSFLPEGNIPKQSRRGARMASALGYSVPRGSLEFWMGRFDAHGIPHGGIATRFGERYLAFYDPDGLAIELTEAEAPDDRKGWTTEAIGEHAALKGFHGVTLTLNCVGATGTILTELFGYRLVGQEGNRYRYATPAVDNAAIVDILVIEEEEKGSRAPGTIHHIAFRVKDDDTLLHYRELIAELGLGITPRIDRQYFHSAYFREPGGVLFEIATEGPGFTVDETVDNLGRGLQLPPAYECRRSEIEQGLVHVNCQIKESKPLHPACTGTGTAQA